MRLLTKTTIYIATLSLFLFFIMGILFFQVLKNMSLADLDHELNALKEVVNDYLERDPAQLPSGIPGIDTLAVMAVASVETGKSSMGDTLMLDPETNQYRTYRYLLYREIFQGTPLEIKIYKSTTPADQLVEQVTLMMTIMVILFISGIFVLNRFIFANLWKDFFHALEKLKAFDTVKEPLTLGEPDIEEFRELFQELEQMTARLSEDYRELKEYTDHTTHELQTPLAIIKTKTELLMQSDRLGPDEMQLIHAINASTDQLSRLNSTLALITRIENRQYPSREAINLTRLVDEHLEMMQELISLRGISVTKTYPEKEMVVSMDRGLANVMITNLLKNAVVHNRDQGTIGIRISAHQFVISNEGTPLHFDEESLFKRFVRDTKKSGTFGLGLSLVKKICDTYGYEIHYRFEGGRHAFMINFGK
ncbi:MAG: sensor histidine kinase [Bacteroidales bacterium]